MHGSGWSDAVWRAVLCILLVAVASRVAWELLAGVLPVALTFAGLLLVIRLAVGGWQRKRGW